MNPAAAAGAPRAARQAPGRTFVLVHGAWHGGWCWSRVSSRLRQAGHQVLTPTCTGLGERSHLLSRDITVDTFVKDVTNVLTFEDLSDVILVGHSFGGIAITGAADKAPDRIGHLVYLDALIVQPGQSAFETLPPDVVAARIKAAGDSSGGLSLPVPPASMFHVTDAQDARWVDRHLTPHPLGAYTSVLDVENPVGNGRPRTYVACTDPVYSSLESSRTWVKAQPDWRWLDLPTGHDAMVTAPEELTRMLIAIGDG